MIAHVAHSYRKFAEANDDVALGGDLITDINGHPTQFPVATFGATMTAFAPIQAAYVILVDDAKGGDAIKVSARNTYRKNTWLPQVDKIANLVDIQAGGDPSIIMLAGFHATKQNPDASVTPVKMTLSGGSSDQGLFQYESKTIVDSHNFALVGIIVGEAAVTQNDEQIIVTTTAPTKITFVNTNNKKGTVKSLDSKKEMSWYMIPKNPAGSGPKSNDVTLIIQ